MEYSIYALGIPKYLHHKNYHHPMQHKNWAALSYWLCFGVHLVFENGDQGCQVVELCLLQDPLLGEVGVYDEFPVAEVVENGREIPRVSVDKVGPFIIL